MEKVEVEENLGLELATEGVWQALRTGTAAEIIEVALEEKCLLEGGHE